MLKTALFDCAVNENVAWLMEDRHLPSFFIPTPGDLTAQESPPLREFAIQGKKRLMPGVSPGGWLVQLELADALSIWYFCLCLLSMNISLLVLNYIIVRTVFNVFPFFQLHCSY